MDGESTEEPDLCDSPGPLEIALDCSSAESSSCETAAPSPREPSPVEPAPPLAANNNNASKKKTKKIGRRFAESPSMKKKKKERDSASGADTAGGSARAPRKRKSYSVTEKLALVAEVEAGRKKVDICREYGISASTLASITKHKEQFMAAYEESRLKAKRLRKATREDLDRALLRWYHQATASGTPISGPLLQAKAEKIAADLGYENCSVPNAWIDRFKKRHALTYARERKEMGADIPDVDTWLNTSWPQLRAGYSSWDIFSAVETGLFFRALPKEAAQLNGASCEQGQLAQDRFTIYLCTNMTGDERRPLMVVGASPLPHSIVLPGLTYAVNEKSWMTRRVFVEELRRWDRELESRKRKVLLLVDQTGCHELGKKANLKNIDVIYPPPNTSGLLIPLDQGVVHSLKRNYRRALLVHTVLQEIPTVLQVHEALRLLAVAWRDVKDKTVRSAFGACGLHSIHHLNDSAEEDGDRDETDDPLELWSSHYDLPEDLVDGIGEFENIDEFVATSAKLQTDQVGEDAGEPRLSSSRTDGNALSSKKADGIAPYEVLDAVDLLLKYCENSPFGISRADAEKAAVGLNALRASAQVTAFKRTYSLDSK
uniref:Tigger transposase n=1 Tax=Rhipicephalus zambeziensis TaxID=60191 RepID=A0A224Z619_9ACAR